MVLKPLPSRSLEDIAGEGYGGAGCEVNCTGLTGTAARGVSVLLVPA